MLLGEMLRINIGLLYMVKILGDEIYRTGAQLVLVVHGSLLSYGAPMEYGIEAGVSLVT